MRRALIITCSTLAAIFLVAVAVIFYLLHDGDWIKGQLEDFISEQSGRQFTISGPLDIDLSLHPVLEAKGISLANAPWASSADMVTLSNLRLSFGLLSLFSDQFVIHFIEADGLVVALAKNDQGDTNWDLFPPADEDATPVEAPMERLPFSLARFSLTHFTMSHDAPARAEPLDLNLSEFQALVSDAGQIDVSLNGSTGGLPLSMDGQLGPLEHLVSGGQLDLNANLDLGEIELYLEGHLMEIQSLKGADLSINFSGPEFTWITHHFALPDFSSGPFDFNLLLDTEANHTKINLLGNLGSLEINANGTVDDLTRLTEGQLTFDITGPNLELLAEAFGRPELPPLSYRLQGDVTSHLGALQVHDLQLNVGENSGRVSGRLGKWPEFQDTELDLVFQGPDLSQWGPVLGLEGMTARSFDLTGRLSNNDSGTVLTTVRFESEGSHLEIAGSLGKAPDFVGSALQIDIMTPDLGRIAVLSSYGELPALPLSVHGSVERRQGSVVLDKVRVELGNDLVILGGDIALADKFYGSELSISGTIQSVAALGHLFDVQGLPDFPAIVNADIGWSADGLKLVSKDSRFGDLKFSLDGMLAQPQEFDGAAFAFELAVPNLRQLPVEMELQTLPEVPARVSGSVEYRSKIIDLSNISGSVGDAAFDFDARLTGQEGYVGSHLNFHFGGPDLKGFFAGKYPSLPTKKFSAAGRIELGSDADQISGLVLELGELRATVDGSVDDLARITSADVGVTVSGPDLSKFTDFTQQDLPALPFSLNAALAGTGQVFSLDPFGISLGPSDLFGDIHFDLRDATVINGRLRSKYLDLAWLVSSQGEESGEASDSATIAGDQAVFPDSEIPTFELGGMELELDLAIERLRLNMTELSGVVLQLSLHEDLLQLDPFEFGGPLGEKVFGKLKFGGNAQGATLDFIMEANDFRFGLAAAEGQDVNTFPPTDITIDIVGAGVTYHELASSLNGRFRVVQGGGLIANGGLDLIFSDLLSELFNTLNPFAKKSIYTKLECSLTNAEIVDGKVLLKPFIFQTEELTIFSGGEIDLETEEMNLDFETKLRKGIGLSAGMVINPFIKLGGSLSSPGIELDPARVAIAGGVAVATVGLSLVGKSLWDRFLTSKDPCGKALARLEEDAERSSTPPGVADQKM